MVAVMYLAPGSRRGFFHARAVRMQIVVDLVTKCHYYQNVSNKEQDRSMNTTERLIANRERMRCVADLITGLADPVIAHAKLIDAIDIAIAKYRETLAAEIGRRENNG